MNRAMARDEYSETALLMLDSASSSRRQDFGCEVSPEMRLCCFSSDSEPSHTFAQLSKQVANNLSFTVLGHVDGTFFHFHARARGDAQSVIESGMEVRDGH